MKWIRIIGIIIIASFVIYFAFHKSEKISLEGYWNAEEIVLDGKQIFSTEIDKYLVFENQIRVSDWSDSIYIPRDKNEIAIKYLASKNTNGGYQIQLWSKEKSLNGIFELSLDTLILGPNFMEVDVKIKSKNTFINFKRKVNTTPRKPELPRKGLV